MRIIKDKDNVVLFAGMELTLTNAGLSGPGWKAPGINSSMCTLEEVDNIPDDFQGGHYYKNGNTWNRTITGEAAYQKQQADILSAIKADIKNSIQAMLDLKAQQHRYDSIHTACGWADSFDDAAALKAWGVACWQKAKDIEAQVRAGTRSMPTTNEIMAEMPEFTIQQSS